MKDMDIRSTASILDDKTTLVIYHGNEKAATVNLYERHFTNIDENHLPYSLKDIDANRFIDRFKDWLSSRILDLSRSNAKTILNVLALPQTMRMSDKIQIALKCNALTMKDTYWVTTLDDNRRYGDVSLRTQPLSEVCYEIAILGKHISATLAELKPELVTSGMYPKYWKREANGDVVLCKSNKASEDVRHEIQASRIFEQLGIDVVRYRYTTEQNDQIELSVSDLITQGSLVEWWEIKDWCDNIGKNSIAFLKNDFREQTANMVIGDYVTANTDRHTGNFGVIVGRDGTIQRFAPLYDFNQCLASDQFNTKLSELIYEPLMCTYQEAVFWAVRNLPEETENRIQFIQESEFSSPVQNRIRELRNLIVSAR